jgi:hypothetical protein
MSESKKMPGAKSPPAAQDKTLTVPVSPDQRTLALLAALIAPEESKESPTVALKKAALLWANAGAFLELYTKLSVDGTDTVLRFLASDIETFEEWVKFERLNKTLEVGTEGASPLLDYVNAGLSEKMKFKTLRNLRKYFSIKDGVTQVAASDFDPDIHLRKVMESVERNDRRRKRK